MKFFKIYTGLLFIFLFIGCQTSSPKNSPVTSDTVVGPKSSQPSMLPQGVQLPDFVSQRAPKVGLILGPGGAKTLAHVGVLQELEQHKIPVMAIVGLEWGSLIAGLYAMNGQSHEVDWKISQLEKPDAGSKKIFSKKLSPANTNDISQYLQKIFSQARMESAKIPWTCPFVNSKKIALAKKGSVVTAIKSCLPFPPVYELNDIQAAPYALAEATDFLRNQGAELILLVNVLPRVEKADFLAWTDGDWAWHSWLTVQESLTHSKFYGVHETIKVDTTSFSMLEVDQRLRLIQVGKQGSVDAIERLVQKYDF